MYVLAGIILLALLGRVEPFKLSLKPPSEQGEYFPPPPPPSIQHQPLYPSQDYVQQQHYENLESSGVKGAKPEREVYYRPPPAHPVYLPNPQPAALAYVIVRPIHYPYYAYGRPAPEYLNERPNYHEQRPLASSGLKGGEEIRIEQQALHQEPELPLPVRQEEAQLDINAEKKGKLQRLKEKFHSMLSFGSTYQMNDEPPLLAAPPAPQPAPLRPLPPLPPQQQPISQVKEPVPEQQHIEQLHTGQEEIREPEPLKEERGSLKAPHREPVGELKRERDNLNTQQVSNVVPQEPSQADTGFDASKRSSTN